MKIKQFFYGLVLGGIAAGVSTLLTAPQSGKEVRTSLKENKDLWKSQLADLKKSLTELKAVSVVASREAKAQTSIFLQETKNSINTWKEDIYPHQEELKEEITEIEAAIQQLEASLADTNKQKS